MFNNDNKKIIKKYLSEEICFNEFVNAIKTNKKLFTYLTKRRKIEERIKKIQDQKDFKFIDEVGLYCSIKDVFFKCNKKNCKGTSIEIYNFLLDNLPDWFDGYNINFLYKIYIEKNLNFNDEKSIELYKTEISKHFRFDNYPPKFLTSFDWPEKDNIPLCFKEMHEIIEDGIITVKYNFYDQNDPNELIEILQTDYK
jgi:hypothetical protein